jgi:hypothetical protein
MFAKFEEEKPEKIRAGLVSTFFCLMVGLILICFTSIWIFTR